MLVQVRACATTAVVGYVASALAVCHGRHYGAGGAVAVRYGTPR